MQNIILFGIDISLDNRLTLLRNLVFVKSWIISVVRDMA